MALAELLKDPRLQPPPGAIAALKKRGLSETFVRALTADFVARRVRRLVELNPGHADPAQRDDITPAATPVLAGVIAGELPQVYAAADLLSQRVSADADQLPLDGATLRKRGTGRVASSALLERRRLVTSIVFQAAAADITLAGTAPVGGAAAGVDRLHFLCDRRLRIVERMLYDVGWVGPRGWSRKDIEAHRGGPWHDGYDRIFDYPRLPPSQFLGACQPDTTAGRRCRPPMNDWWHSAGDTHVRSLARASPAAAASWPRSGEYELDFDPGGGVNGVTAIQKLFQPSRDLLGRNLMFCDHVINALHLEALVFAKVKRGHGTAWLDADVTSRGARWLRIHYQFGNGDRFLGSSSEPRFFQHTTVRERDLQVGDHVIIYNHPAYSHATMSGVWRLENALVVQTVPDLRMQGHGSFLQTKAGMWADMIGLFNSELERRRADVEGLARITAFGANTLTVDRSRFLSPGMLIDIVSDDAGETVVAAGRIVLSVTGRAVRYGGASVAAAGRHRVRRARSTFEGRFEAIESLGIRILRRTPASTSSYEGRHQRADWFLAWDAGADEEAIRANPTSAAFIKRHQLIEYTRETFASRQATIGWFPLWIAGDKGKQPLRRGGRIAATTPVVVEPGQVAGWTRFFDADPAKRDRVPVIRPMER